MLINKEELNQIFGSLDKDKCVAILTHTFPDPDAMGAAAGFSALLKEVYGLNSKIFHFGAITHPQNKSLKNILHIAVEDAKNFDNKNISATVVLDTDLTGSGLKNKVDKVAVRLDHHDMDRDCAATFSDVRVIGSCCSIVWQYLLAFGIDMKKHPEVATALVLGIETDTSYFTSENTTNEDIDAFRELLFFADKGLMARINKYPLPKYYFEIESKAFKDKEQKNTSLVSFLGDVSSHRDIIATVADRFIRIDGIETVMIMGIVDNSIVASIRTEDSRVEINDIISRIFGKENGGGKGYSGGATFPLGAGIAMVADKKIRESAINEIVNGFKQKLFEVLGEKTEEEADVET
ncbi:MAG: DHH family phosphoesterase [Patescibacteria group bacterium]